MNPFKLLGTIETLLVPIQRALAAVLPDFLEQSLETPETRKKIVDAADKVLIKAVPEARLVPTKIRKRLISKSLDIILDDILLPE